MTRGSIQLRKERSLIGQSLWECTKNLEIPCFESLFRARKDMIDLPCNFLDSRIFKQAVVHI
jgi:hypothetical protein